MQQFVVRTRFQRLLLVRSTRWMEPPALSKPSMHDVRMQTANYELLMNQEWLKAET